MNEVWYNQHVKEDSDQDLTLDQTLKLLPVNVIRDLLNGFYGPRGLCPLGLRKLLNTCATQCAGLASRGMKSFSLVGSVKAFCLLVKMSNALSAKEPGIIPAFNTLTATTVAE